MLFLVFLIIFIEGIVCQFCNTTVMFNSINIQPPLTQKVDASFVKIKYFSINNMQAFVGLTDSNELYLIDLYTKSMSYLSSNTSDFFVTPDLIFSVQGSTFFPTLYYKKSLDIFNRIDLPASIMFTSVCYDPIGNVIYLYSNSTFEIFAHSNFTGKSSFGKIFSSSDLNLITQDNKNGTNKGVTKLEFDNMHNDLYIVINNYVYIWDTVQKRIWCRCMSSYFNMLDDILLFYDDQKSEQKFHVVNFDFQTSSINVWRPNFKGKNSTGLSSVTSFNVYTVNIKIKAVTKIFDSEYYVVALTSGFFHIFTFDGILIHVFYYPPLSTTQKVGLVGNIENLDQFYLFDLNQRKIGANLTVFSIFAEFPNCDNCHFKNLIFYPFLFGCAKQCDSFNINLLNKCRPSCSATNCNLPCVYNLSFANPLCSTILQTGCSNGLCQICPLYNKSSCLDCSANNYFDLLSQTQCYSQCPLKNENTMPDTNIKICSDGPCSLSQLAQNTSNGVSCIAYCNKTCQTCENDTNTCTSCPNGLFLKDNQCVQNCPGNISPWIFNDSTMLLTRYCCTILWQLGCVNECPIGTYLNNSVCQLTCNQSYYYQPNLGCQKTCPTDPLYYVNVSNGVNLCLPKCPNNLYFQLNSTTNYTCVDTCSNGYFNYNNQSCQSCMANCSSCKTNSSCEVCFEYFQNFNNICIMNNTSNNTNKSNNTNNTNNINNTNNSNYTNDTNKTTENTTINCSDPCKTCLPSNSSICLSCNDSMVFFDNYCYVSCPLKSFQISNQNICKECNDSNCLICSDEYTCRSCSQNYLLNLTYCITSCLLNEYYDPNATLCLSCSSNCSSCFGSSPASCLSCQTPLYLKGTECKSPCNFQDQCTDLNLTVNVTLQKSFSLKSSFFIVFSKDLEIPSYINLTNLINLTIENVDSSFYSYSIERVDGYSDRLLVAISCNVSVQHPIVSINFTNYSDTYIHGKYNSSFNIGNNSIGINITLDDIVIPTENPSTFEIKQQATSRSFEGLLGSIVSMSVFTYLICTSRMSLFWFLTDAMQLLSTLLFLNLNYSLRLLDCFAKMLFFHGFFLFSIGKEFNENSQKFTYFGYETKDNYEKNNFVKFYLTANFIPNGLPPLFLILLIYAIIFLFKLILFLNRKVFKYDEEKGLWGLMNYFYNYQLFSILLRAHFVLMYIILISAFFQIENLSFNTSWNKYGSIFAILSLIYYFVFFLYVTTRLCNSKEVYENDELICAYECVFYNLEIFSFLRRNHFLIIQIKKFFVIILLVVFVSYKSDQNFTIFLIIVQVLAIARYIKWRPFQIFKLSLINILTEVWVLLVIITVAKIQNTTIYNDASGAISNDSLKEIESNGDATASLIILLLGGYFFLFCVIFIYYFCKNLDCICYVCFNIKNSEYEKNVEEIDDKNKSLDNSKITLEKSEKNKIPKDLEYSPVKKKVDDEVSCKTTNKKK